MVTRIPDAEPPPLSPLHGAFAGARHDPDVVMLFSGWARLVSGSLGDISGAPVEGFVHGDTRYVSGYRLALDGSPAKRTMTSLTSPSRWCGVFVDPRSGDQGDLDDGIVPRGALELTVLRSIEQGWVETLSLFNHSHHPAIARVSVELVCPLDDVQWTLEMKEEDEFSGLPGLAPSVERSRDGSKLLLVYHREYGRRRAAPTEELRPIFGAGSPRDGELVSRELRLDIPRDSIVELDGEKTRLRWERALAPREGSEIDLRFGVVHDDRHAIEAGRRDTAEPLPFSRSHGSPKDADIVTSSSTLNMILAQARMDLAALELPIFGGSPGRLGERGFVAGVPRYVGTFGRDILTTAWQAAMLTPRFLENAVDRVALHVGTRDDAFRDEEAGRLLHERRINAYSELGESNREVYFGDVASTPFWIVTLATAYHWTGNANLIHRQMPVLEATCAFIERRLVEGGGFVYYAPASPEGNRHHAWKDSGDAVVDSDGRIRLPPIAAAEIQGYCRLALLHAAELMLVARRAARAVSLFRAAEELTARFRRAFFLPERGFYALGLDASGRPIDAIASNIGHCLGCGILAREHLSGVVARLMAEDMFSGWGIRTLSAENPAYDPFSYHRGSVWPVENATIAASMRLHGFDEECERVIAAQLAAATLFDRMRLPEALSGLGRAGDRPIPGVYPRANPLQAWSVSAIPFFLQVLLGIRPFAPLSTLLVEPRLPPWLSSVEVRGLHLGEAKVSLEFHRDRRGAQRWRAFDREGTVHVLERSTSESLSKLRALVGARVRSSGRKSKRRARDETRPIRG